ncbi:SMP-30/gluconolactonase/LRE family protein [Agrobacterium sp. NPDC089420]|uniref:SMP-30/gluconolactonase/LRE family protein n=1 Tax=Agrobacterium sp. NPDC089420 TaxID=3363918 RepID=UPI00384B9981
MSNPEAAFVVAERFGAAESPTWDAATGELFWCDIPAGTIHSLVIESGQRKRWSFGEPVASFGLADSGRLVVALSSSIVFFNLETGKRELIATIRLPAGVSRLNDGKVGPDGAFYVGSMDRSATTPQGALYRVDESGRTDILTSGFSASNGLAWTGDGQTMFHSDSQGEMFVDRWDFCPQSGAISNRRRLRAHDLANGRADGGAFDTASVYWSAAPSCSRLNCIALDGTLLRWVELPISKPAMPCFGGADMCTVYVTSLDSGLSGTGKDGIVSFRSAVPGLLPYIFGRRSAK